MASRPSSSSTLDILISEFSSHRNQALIRNFFLLYHLSPIPVVIKGHGLESKSHLKRPNIFPGFATLSTAVEGKLQSQENVAKSYLFAQQGKFRNEEI